MRPPVMRYALPALLASAVAAPGLAQVIDDPTGIDFANDRRDIVVELDTTSGELTLTSTETIGGFDLSSESGSLIPGAFDLETREDGGLLFSEEVDFLVLGQNDDGNTIEFEVRSNNSGVFEVNNNLLQNLGDVTPFSFGAVVDVASLGEIDANDDGFVDNLLFLVRLQPPPGDQNGLTEAIGVTFDGGSSAIPEPASAGLLALGAVAMLRRRRSA